MGFLRVGYEGAFHASLDETGKTEVDLYDQLRSIYPATRRCLRP